MTVWGLNGKGEPLILRGCEDRATGVAFSPDSKHVAASCADRSVYVWDADGGGEPVVQERQPRAVNAVAYGPDGLLVGAGDDGEVIVWDDLPEPPRGPGK